MLLEPHLDANQLSALLGNSLAPATRRQALDHLSHCEHCRQCAVLTQHGLQGMKCGSAPASMPAPVRAWPAWRGWAAAAAAVVVVAGGIFAARPALILAPAARLAPVTRPIAMAVPHASITTARVSVRPNPTRSSVSALTANPPAATVANSEAVVNTADFVFPAPPGRAAALASTALPLPTPPAPTTAENGEFKPPMDFTPLTTGFQDQPRLRVIGPRLADWTIARPAPSNLTLAVPVSKVSPISASSSMAGVEPAWTGPAFDNMAMAAAMEGFAAAPSLRLEGRLSGPYAPAAPTGFGWAISRGGEVLRSIGAGMWAAVPLLPNVRVHALFAGNGMVWAGGTADQLYVSTDRGAHWRHVLLPAPTTQPASISSILFTSPRTGTVTLDNGSDWITTDGGKTWSHLQ